MALQKKILMVSHGAAATGFSRVAEGIISPLMDKYQFFQFATNHRQHSISGRWPVYGNPDDADAYGLQCLEELITTIEPQIVLIMNDLWFFCMHLPKLIKRKNRPVLMGYIPIDGKISRPELYSGIAHLDKIIAYTNFGKKEIMNILKKNEENSNGTNYDNIEIIPHGVDTNVFKPLGKNNLLDKREAKKLYFKNEEDENGFIVLNAAKHQPRKRMDITIEGFAKFAQNKPSNVKLYLHTGATFDGPDLRILASKAGISDRMLTTPGWIQNHPAVSDEILNLLYNACDVGINTSMGEGWGLISFEHAATGAPQIIPDHSACTELWKGVQNLLPIKNEMEHSGLGMFWSEVDTNDVALELERLYEDKNYRLNEAKKAFDHSQKLDYQWENISELWDSQFSKF